jgi:hypothetical protein
MDARTRERLPVLPILVRTVDERRKAATALLEAARQTPLGDTVTTNGSDPGHAHSSRTQPGGSTWTIRSPADDATSAAKTTTPSGPGPAWKFFGSPASEWKNYSRSLTTVKASDQGPGNEPITNLLRSMVPTAKEGPAHWVPYWRLRERRGSGRLNWMRPLDNPPKPSPDPARLPTAHSWLCPGTGGYQMVLAAALPADGMSAPPAEGSPIVTLGELEEILGQLADPPRADDSGQ